MKTDWEALDDLADSALATPRREVFLAIRTDGGTGDGSMANPYSAGTAGEFDIVMRRAFHRNPDREELRAATAFLHNGKASDLFWTLLTSAEFQLNH